MIKYSKRWLEKYIDDGRRLWVFHHIRKTAGSSLAVEFSRILKPNYNFAFGARMSDRLDISEAEREDEIVRQFIKNYDGMPIRFANGHLQRRHILMLKENIEFVSFFTFLREPFSRVVSAFRYGQTDMHPSHKEFMDAYPTFEAFLDAETGEAAAERNAMCKSISGNEENPSFEEARDILETEYAFCGIFELYDLSFQAVSALMRSPRLPSVHVRKTPAKVQNEIRDLERYRRLVLVLNHEDVKLYHFFCDRLIGDRRRWSWLVGSMRRSLTTNHKSNQIPLTSSNVLVAGFWRWLKNRELNRQASYIRPFVDQRFYADTYGVAAGEDSAIHYVTVGWKNGFDPCPWFSTRRYIEEYSDVAASNMNPFYHYLRFGRDEGRYFWSADLSIAGALPTNEIRRYEFSDLAITIETARYTQNRYIFIAGTVDMAAAHIRFDVDSTKVFSTMLLFKAKRDTSTPLITHKFQIFATLLDAGYKIESSKLTVRALLSDRDVAFELKLRSTEPQEFSRLIANAACNYWRSKQGLTQTALSWVRDVCTQEQKAWADAAFHEFVRLRWSGWPIRVMMITRHHSHIAYVETSLLLSAFPENGDIVLCVCSDGLNDDDWGDAQPSENLPRVHRVVLNPETSSTAIIKSFLGCAHRDGASSLVILDYVSIAPVLGPIVRTLAESRSPSAQARAWAISKENHTGPADPSSPARAAPSRIGVLFVPARAEMSCLADVPPFFGRGYALDMIARGMRTELDGSVAIDLGCENGRSNSEILNQLFLDHSDCPGSERYETVA